MERPMNRKLAATVSVAALCICGELGRSMLRPYIVTAQDGAIAPAENLGVAGVPAIPASLVETAGRYRTYRSAPLSVWNPLRRRSEEHTAELQSPDHLGCRVLPA